MKKVVVGDVPVIASFRTLGGEVEFLRILTVIIEGPPSPPIHRIRIVSVSGRTRNGNYCSRCRKWRESKNDLVDHDRTTAHHIIATLWCYFQSFFRTQIEMLRRAVVGVVGSPLLRIATLSIADGNKRHVSQHGASVRLISRWHGTNATIEFIVMYAIVNMKNDMKMVRSGRKSMAYGTLWRWSLGHHTFARTKYAHTSSMLLHLCVAVDRILQFIRQEFDPNSFKCVDRTSIACDVKRRSGDARNEVRRQSSEIDDSKKLKSVRHCQPKGISLA